MTYRIYVYIDDYSYLGQSKLYSFPYISEDGFEIVDEFTKADVVIINSVEYSLRDKLFLFLRGLPKNILICHSFLFHIDEWQTENNFINLLNEYRSEGINNVIILHKNNKIPNSKNTVYYDMMFNIVKTFYFEYDKDKLLKNKLRWMTESTEKMFELEPIKKYNLKKKFLIINKTYPDQPQSFRTSYRKILSELNIANSYYSDMSQNIFIESQEQISITDMKTHSSWLPAHNSYYQTSLVSVYVESVVGYEEDTGEVGCITEKTFDPLIKGNFILPFGYKGIIEDIRRYGFLLPDWIDYSYDTEPNRELRFEKFVSSIRKLESLSLDECQSLYDENISILNYNRQVVINGEKSRLNDTLNHMRNVKYYIDNDIIYKFGKFYDLPFIFGDGMIEVSDPNEADIIPVLLEFIDGSISLDQINEIKRLRLENKLIIVVFLFHIDNWHKNEHYDEIIHLFNNNGINNVIILHKNNKIPNNKNTLYYDMMFNRQKAYFTDYTKYDLRNKIWSGIATEKMYKIDDIVKIKCKRFFIVNKTYEGSDRSIYRAKMNELDFYDSYYFNPTAGLPAVNQENLENYSFSPAHNSYYQTSLVSVYVESVVGYEEDTGEVGCITEKTFDPLIKGNFILPFGYKGIIEDIRRYGFLLPDWIDYSYDTEPNRELRFEKFVSSIRKLESLSLDELFNMVVKDYSILIYNRSIFDTRPYDALYIDIRYKLKDLK